MNALRIIATPLRCTRSFWTKKKKNYGKYSVVEPGNVSPIRPVPAHIIKPPYYETGEPPAAPLTAEIKTEAQISAMRESCRLAANILKSVGNKIQVGMTTDEIDKAVHDMAIENNAYPSPLNYKHFPKSVCTSVNNVACHGIPDDRPLEDGDIVNVDVTVYLNGYHGDCSRTFCVGNVDEIGRKLVAASEVCLDVAIKNCKPDVPFSWIGKIIEEKAYELGFFIVPCFAGHGIGSYFHGPPDVFHIMHYKQEVMKAGMTFTIEPVLTQGSVDIEILEDNWTAVTLDSARTAQTEHTVLVTNDGVEVLTVPS